MIFLLDKILLQNSGVRFPLLFERKVKYQNSNFQDQLFMKPCRDQIWIFWNFNPSV